MNSPGADVIRSHHALRGVAAVLVLLYHFRDVTPSVGQAIDSHTVFFSDGRIWVDFFFILSGFILSHVYGAAMSAKGVKVHATRRFYLARFARIYPLHFATLLAMIAVELSAYVLRPEIADAFASDRKSWGSILQHLTLTHAWLTMDRLEWNVPSWSISTEAFAYLAFPLLLLLSDHGRWAVRALLPIAAMTIYVHTFANFSDIGDQQPLARCMAGFIAGMLLHRLWRQRRARVASVATLLQVAAMAVAIAALHLGWSQAVILFALALLILSTADDRGPVARVLMSPPLLLLGTLSYSLYMTHWIFYRLYWMYGGYVFSGLAGSYSPIKVYALKVFLLVALTFALSYFTYRRIELPARWHLNRLLAR
ncbi:MAG TPA: acyltransferase [Burkholderiaceae bacterium]|nr:acyltransferase [Burkholderiaceae bacterium]